MQIEMNFLSLIFPMSSDMEEDEEDGGDDKEPAIKKPKT